MYYRSEITGDCLRYDPVSILSVSQSFSRQGAAIDDIIREVNVSRQRYERAKKDIREMIILNKV